MTASSFSGGARLRGFLPGFTALLLTSLFVLSGCGKNQPKSNLPMITLQIGRQTFTLEVADTEPVRETGLMNRDSMPANHGMLFVFDDEIAREFWMKNTRIPLDILFVDSNGKIVSIKSMKPYDLNTTPSDAPARFAIELNKGAADSAGIQVGDQLNIPASVQSRTDNIGPSSQAIAPATR
jgi:uncharacterized protein